MKVYRGSTPIADQSQALNEILVPLVEEAVTDALVAGGQKALALTKAGAVANATTVQNDHPNPGAEYNTGGLTAVSSVTVSRDNTGWKASGSYAWKLLFASTSDVPRADSDALTVAPFQPVAVAATFYNNHATDPKTMRIRVRFMNGVTLVQEQYVLTDAMPAQNAETISGVFTAPTGCTSVVVAYGRPSGGGGGAAGDVIYVDDLFIGVGQIAIPALPLDGDADLGYWTGTEGASVSDGIIAIDPLPAYGDPNYLITWGDSLSSVYENAGGGVPVALSGHWPTYLAAKLGAIHVPGGIAGGSDLDIAARMGAVPVLVDDVTIATTGFTILDILNNAWEDSGLGYGHLTDSTGQRLVGQFDCDVGGTITGTPGAYYFARAVPGTAVNMVGPRIQFEPTSPNGDILSGAPKPPLPHSAITTIESRNVYHWLSEGKSHEQAIDIVLSRYRAMVDHALSSARNPRVAVMEIPPHLTQEAPGEDHRIFMDALNTALKTEFRPYWCAYVSEWLLTEDAADALSITYDATDLDNITDGIAPNVWRQDGIHYSDLGGQAIATYLHAWMFDRGWVGPDLS